MPCACCGGGVCCFGDVDTTFILVTPSGAITDGTCEDCEQVLLDSLFCSGQTEYRMTGVPGTCEWTGCCVSNPCFTFHDANPEICGATSPALVGTLVQSAGTSSGVKLTLEFTLNPDDTCSGSAEIIARYELDDIDTAMTPCCSAVLPLTLDSGVCVWPATMTLSCIEEGCEA
jgi:hypothetical protein